MSEIRCHIESKRKKRKNIMICTLYENHASYTLISYIDVEYKIAITYKCAIFHSVLQVDSLTPIITIVVIMCMKVFVQYNWRIKTTVILFNF